MLSDKQIHELQASTSSPSSSSEKIARNDDLLREILLRLPIKSLLRSKSVSKHWFSLISDPHFCRRRIPFPTSASGLFLQRSHIHFVPFNDDEDEDDDEDNNVTHFSISLDEGLHLIILHSCNGLLLCGSLWTSLAYIIMDQYVYNPTTKQSTRLPKPGLNVQHVFLAFNPSKSPHYKAVGVSKASDMPENHYQIQIFSSEEGSSEGGGSWRFAGEPFAVDCEFSSWETGVYWNGAIHWLLSDVVYCFDADEERFRDVPGPPISDETEIFYFGESRAHLHLVDRPVTVGKQFNVYEMQRDYSGWFHKYRVDLEPIVAMLPPGFMDDYDAFYLLLNTGEILAIIREETEEDSFLVYSAGGMAICYNLKDRTAKKLCDLPNDMDIYGIEAHQYIESLTRI